MTTGFNGTRKIIDLPAVGAFVAVLATGPVRYVRIRESQLTSMGVANPQQGFQYTIGNDGSPNGNTVVLATPPGQIAELGDPMALQGPHGSMIGNGPGMIIGIGATPATTLFNAQSMSAMGTSIEVTQYY